MGVFELFRNNNLLKCHTFSVIKTDKFNVTLLKRYKTKKPYGKP